MVDEWLPQWASDPAGITDTVTTLLALGRVGVDARMWMDVLVSTAVCLLCFLCISFDFGWGMACISPLVLVRPGLAWCTHVMYLIPEDIEGRGKVFGVSLRDIYAIIYINMD